MTTVLYHRDADGTPRRCDATCHFAKSKTCDCICGGALHGKALTGQLNAAIFDLIQAHPELRLAIDDQLTLFGNLCHANRKSRSTPLPPK